MPRKLKTYQTSQGFYDLAIAAPSMKAALEAWGSNTHLFHKGLRNGKRRSCGRGRHDETARRRPAAACRYERPVPRTRAVADQPSFGSLAAGETCKDGQEVEETGAR
jgi:hypothetical protein